uniref:Endo/exonuclease/phosphatase domain-containing protein n=1 Tax=Macrostomum lignano TaxID=282301 RepID=A0A1I8FDZ5_9PLAT
MPPRRPAETGGTCAIQRHQRWNGLHAHVLATYCCEGYATKKAVPLLSVLGAAVEYPENAALWMRFVSTRLIFSPPPPAGGGDPSSSRCSSSPSWPKAAYDGIFSAKSRAKQMSASESKYVDGVAIFWKKERFNLIKEDVIEFSRAWLLNATEKDCKCWLLKCLKVLSDVPIVTGLTSIAICQDNHEMINRVMVKDNIALMAIFEVKDEVSAQSPPAGGVHRAHSLGPGVLRREGDPVHHAALPHCGRRSKITWQQRPGVESVDVTSMPLIICGDFNSLPESGVFEYLATGKINKSSSGLQRAGYENILDKLTPHRSQHHPELLEHDLNLRSLLRPGGRHAVHQLHVRFPRPTFGCLDMIPETWFTEHNILGCPHPHISSDHFSLLVSLSSSRSSSSKEI